MSTGLAGATSDENSHVEVNEYRGLDSLIRSACLGDGGRIQRISTSSRQDGYQIIIFLASPDHARHGSHKGLVTR